MSRPIIAATVLGAAVGALMAASVLFAQADSPMSALSIHNFTFTTPGTYQYFCYLHPNMVGSIVVEAATGSNATQ